MNKVEKLKSIANKKVAILCKTYEEDEEMVGILNKHFDGNMTAIMSRAKYSIIYEDDCYSYSFMLEDYEIILFDEFFKDTSESPTVKELKDWTLGELKEYCQDRECSDCVLQSNICEVIKGLPSGLNLNVDITPKVVTKLTQSEIEILKAIKVLYPNSQELEHDVDSFSFYVDEDFKIPEVNLPSLSHNVTYNIDELLKENE